jgi:hypothetical protein
MCFVAAILHFTESDILLQQTWQWVEYSGKYLGGYATSESNYIFSTLEAAQAVAGTQLHALNPC